MNTCCTGLWVGAVRKYNRLVTTNYHTLALNGRKCKRKSENCTRCSCIWCTFRRVKMKTRTVSSFGSLCLLPFWARAAWGQRAICAYCWRKCVANLFGSGLARSQFTAGYLFVRWIDATEQRKVIEFRELEKYRFAGRKINENEKIIQNLC